MIFTAAFAAGLALLQYLLYFHSNRHFFQGDSLYYFQLRYRTVKEFLLGFTSLDPAGWYRPLTARTVQSLLYPWFGLEPAAYRIVHYLLFMITIFAIFKLASVVTRRRLAACLATLFFAVHSVNGWTTYDVLFVPELVFTFFYVTAAAAYLRYRQTQNRRLFWLSIACTLAALCSKETASTLPLMFVAVDMILNRTRFRDAIISARAHLAILALYVLLIVGYLGVQRPAFQSILKRPGPEIVYRFSLDRTITNNAAVAATWAFNIPRGWQTESRHFQPRAITFLKFFRFAIIALVVWIMFRTERRIVIAGLVWFCIGIGPALPLFDHFLPYYLFMPVVGFSIALGSLGDAVYRRIATLNRPTAVAVVAVPLMMVAAIGAVGARRDARENRVLGWSSRLAENSMNDLKNAHPTLRPNTTIYISDAENQDLSWDTAQGGLFKMAYNDDTLQALYWGWGEVISKPIVDRGPVVVMKYHDFHLTDITQEFLSASEAAVAYVPRQENKLQVLPAEATAGQKYSLAISTLGNVEVTLHYTLDGGPVHAFTAHLDNQGQASFEISPSTPKGLYKFVGFNKSGSTEWIQAASAIRIY
jgi:hypothetical protein